MQTLSSAVAIAKPLPNSVRKPLFHVCEMTGHFLLTNLLLDKLIASSPSRVINTVGVGYDQTNIDFNDFNLEKSDLRHGEAYNRSKLAMALFTVELARRLEG